MLCVLVFHVVFSSSMQWCNTPQPNPAYLSKRPRCQRHRSSRGAGGGGEGTAISASKFAWTSSLGPFFGLVVFWKRWKLPFFNVMVEKRKKTDQMGFCVCEKTGSVEGGRVIWYLFWYKFCLLQVQLVRWFWKFLHWHCSITEYENGQLIHYMNYVGLSKI